jgi:hypothetical protein
METLRRIASPSAAVVWMLLFSTAAATAQAPAGNGPPQFRPVERTARNDVPALPPVAAHPLQQPLDMAYASLARARELRDCAYTFVKRESIAGKMTDHEAMFMKVRHEPFSIYVYTLGPKQPKGQEAIYVAGRNDDKVLVHVTGIRHKLVGMLSLDPNAPEVMDGNRYPITSGGYVNMLSKIIRLYQQEMAEGVSEVQIIPGAKVDGHVCTCVQVSHPHPGRNFVFHTTRMFYNDATGLPLRWEAYDFPQQPGQAPIPAEEYTYRNVQLNVGLTDADFDPNNPQYAYK